MTIHNNFTFKYLKELDTLIYLEHDDSYVVKKLIKDGSMPTDISFLYTVRSKGTDLIGVKVTSVMKYYTIVNDMLSISNKNHKAIPFNIFLGILIQVFSPPEKFKDEIESLIETTKEKTLCKNDNSDMECLQSNVA